VSFPAPTLRRTGHAQHDRRIVVVIAAHNEETALGPALSAVFAQTREPDAVIVAADNCSDGTVRVARVFAGVTVFETLDNFHKKSGALNQAWDRFVRDADLLVCIDADTQLDPCALRDWEAEFVANPALGGCSAKFTMDVQPGMTRWERFLVRLQKNEFSRWTDTALQRGRKTTVLAGTACCLRVEAVAQLEAWREEREPDCAGPWSQHSLVEDFELTYRFRELGWETKVSASVRAYTDAMTDLRSLWAQRMKWTTGTIRDLFAFGFNRLTVRDWGRQMMGGLTVVVRVVWLALLVVGALRHTLAWSPIWLVPPALFVAESVKDALRVPNRTRSDVLIAALIVPPEFFKTLRCAWFSASWFEVAWSCLGGRAKDRWALQATAETGRRPRIATDIPSASLTTCAPAAIASGATCSRSSRQRIGRSANVSRPFTDCRARAVTSASRGPPRPSRGSRNSGPEQHLPTTRSLRCTTVSKQQHRPSWPRPGSDSDGWL
jgi:hypothetical protein